MGRLTREELDKLMKQENCSRFWSWSRINCFKTSPFEYLLKYIKHIKGDRQDCIYTTTGSMAHDILERLYTNKIGYNDMLEAFDDAWLVAYDLGQLKFDRNDEVKNKSIADKYYENLKHFFTNHSLIPYNPKIEQFIKIRVNNNVFIGYIDCVFKDDNGDYNIIDFKTSSIYKGDKAEKESGQLVLYAIGLNQMGIPFEKIKCAWNFLKYCSIQYEQANGVIKTREVERVKIGESLQSNAKTWLKKLGYADELDYYLKLLLDTNDIKCLPEDVQSKYKIFDCYTYIDLSQKIIDKWTTDILTTIKDICLREKDYDETNSEMCFWDSDESVKAQSFYFATLCEYSGNLHKPYGKYLETLESQKNGLDLFSGVGNNADDIATIDEAIKNNEVDLSWLDSIT